MRTALRFSGWLNVAAAALLVLGVDSPWAQTNPAETFSVSGPAADASEGIRLNFRDAPLDAVLDYLSEAAGFIIVREASIEGRVSVWSHQPLSKDEAAELLNTVLNEKGYAAIRSGRTLTLVKRDEARMRDLPVRTGANPDTIAKSDEMITQIIPVRYADAVHLIENLKPLIPSYATLTANESSNALVLTDTQSNVRRMVEIIQALDTSISSISEFKVFLLQYADATDLAEVINQVFEAQEAGTSSTGSRARRIEQFFARMRGGPPGAPQESSETQSIARQAASRVVAVADERTNSLVVTAPAELMATIEQLVLEVDTVAEDITEVKVFHLQYADAEEMAEIIKNVFGQASQSSQQQRQSRRFFQGGPFGGPPGGQPGQESQSSRSLEESEVQAVADTRTNSVVVSAAKQTMPQIEGMVRSLDENPAKEKRVFVYSLENADAESVADILKGMFEESSGQRGGTTSGSNRLRQSVGTQDSGSTTTQRQSNR